MKLVTHRIHGTLRVLGRNEALRLLLEKSQWAEKSYISNHGDLPEPQPLSEKSSPCSKILTMPSFSTFGDRTWKK